MKVLQVVKTNRGATWAFNQAVELSNLGVEVVTVLPNITDGFAIKYKEKGLKVISGDWSLPIKKPWAFFGRKKEINSVVEEEKPDIIHMHFVTNVLMIRLALRKNNTPRLFQVPGPLHLENFLVKKIEIFTSQKNDFWAGACKKTCEIYESEGINSLFDWQSL